MGDWTLVDTHNGTSPFTLPSNYTEICIMARNGGNNLEAFSIVIPKVLLSSTTTQRFRAGYGSTSNPNFVAYDVLTGSVSLHSAMLDNTNTTSTTRTSVLYR